MFTKIKPKELLGYKLNFFKVFTVKEGPKNTKNINENNNNDDNNNDDNKNGYTCNRDRCSNDSC